MKHLPTFDGVGADGQGRHGRPYISASSLLMFMECGHKWYLRYVKKLKPSKGWKAEWGVVFHSTMEDALNYYRENGFHMSAELMYERYVHHLDERLLKTGLTADLTRDFGSVGIASDKFKDEGHKLVRLFLRDPNGVSGLHPTHVELEHRWPMEPEHVDGCPGDDCGCPRFDIKVKIDIVEAMGDRTVIDDFKTTSSQWTLDAGHKAWLPGTVYAGAWHDLTGEMPDILRLIRVNRRERKPFIDTAEATREMEDVEDVKALAKTAVRLMQLDIFPADGLGKRNGNGYEICRSCDYAQLCEPRRRAIGQSA